jgi:dTMP kinase
MFLTFEGIDFCGKSTQVDLLKNYLVSTGKQVQIIREPGGTEISEKIRDILLDKQNHMMFMETEFLLFSASRAQLVREKIKPYLDKGYYVISDRFHDSSTAYQGFGRGIPYDQIVKVNQMAIGDNVPDITFFIDIPVEEAQRRKEVSKNIELDRIEISEDNFYSKVREGYYAIAEKDKRIKILNGMNSIESIHSSVKKEIEKIEKSVSNEK